MKVLLVNNYTPKISEFFDFFINESVTTVFLSDLKKVDCTNYDLIVLSGSRRTPLMENPSFYSDEIELIKSSQIPIIGICMGFEVICYTFGSKLSKLKRNGERFLDINITNDDHIFEGNKTINVIERHKWSVLDVRKPLIELARSFEGIEAVKHESREIYGFQFHPELVRPDNKALFVLRNLVDKYKKIRY